MYRYYKKCRPSPRLLFLSDSKWIINIRRNVSVSSIKNFVLDSDSERLICISLDTIVFIINSLGKWWKKRRFAWELFIFGFNYLQKDTILSTIFFFFKDRSSFLWIAKRFHSFVEKVINKIEQTNPFPRTIDDLESNNGFEWIFVRYFIRGLN